MQKICSIACKGENHKSLGVRELEPNMYDNFNLASSIAIGEAAVCNLLLALPGWLPSNENDIELCLKTL